MFEGEGARSRKVKMTTSLGANRPSVVTTTVFTAPFKATNKTKKTLQSVEPGCTVMMSEQKAWIKGQEGSGTKKRENTARGAQDYL